MRILGCVAFALAAVPSLASAAPYIIATSVTSACRNRNIGPPTTVTVMLNAVTHTHYGTTLFYNFIPVNGGTPITKPSPNGLNPVFLGGIPPGSYNLRITTGGVNATPDSPDYPIMIPVYQVRRLGFRYYCPAVRQERTAIKGAMIAP